MQPNLPSSPREFDLALETGEPLQLSCVECDRAFSTENVHTPAGWRETQMSGLCEDCFDRLFEEPNPLGEKGDDYDHFLSF